MMDGARHSPDDSSPAADAVGNRPIAATLALIALLKLALLVAYGPITLPDTGDYLAYARTILQSFDWVYDAHLAGSPLPLAYRMIGFPAILAASLKIGGAAWPYVVIGLQFALSLYACWHIYRLALELGLAWKAAIAAVIAFATSIQLTIDQTLVTDSIHASLVIIAVCILSHHIASRRPLGLGEAVLAGILLALAFLIRDAMQFLFMVFLPVLAARVLVARGPALRAVALCLALIVPVFATVEAYKTWNYFRTGERFVAPIGQLTILYFLTRAARADPQVLGGDTVLETVARRHVQETSPDILNVAYAVSYEMFDRGYRATDNARLSYALYFKAWRDHPAAMFSVIRAHVSERLFKLAFRPLTSICLTIEWGTKAKECPDERVLMRAALTGFAGAGWQAAALFLLGSSERIISIAITVAFLVGVPVLLIGGIRRQGLDLDPAIMLTAAFWLMAVGWTAAYAAVVMEERYLAPIIPFVIISGLLVIQRLVASARQSRRLRAV